MSTALDIRSANEILAEMVSKVLAETELTDISPGSELSKILEAAAISDFQTEVTTLNLLQTQNLDNLDGADLIAKAVDLRLPNGSGGVGAMPAKQSSGIVTISSPFKKKASTLYQGKPAPFVGATVIYVQDAQGWPTTNGKIYIGRGTDRPEGPIQYATINNDIIRPFYAITLTTPISLNHTAGETVVLAQGGLRRLPSGLQVIAPSVNSAPAITFTTDQAVILLDGEDTINTTVTCDLFGTSGNIQAGAIQEFASAPFYQATVTNPSAFASGEDAESDTSLRQRIKDYYSTLSKGTVKAIQSYLRGLKDPVSGKTIVSTNVLQPSSVGSASKAYIDDGQGLEPAYQGISYESLIDFSAGVESIFRTSKSPILAPMAQGAAKEPYFLQEQQTLSVSLDDVTETFTVNASNYVNISSALASEIVNDFNSQNSRVRFRTSSNHSKVDCFDLRGDSETLTVQKGTIQKYLGLPTTTFRPLCLYKNNSLLSQKGTTATIGTKNFPWTAITEDKLVSSSIIVDGVKQTFSITELDFVPASIATANITDWARVFASKIAGVKITPVVRDDKTSFLQFQTRNANSEQGSLQVVDGPWMGIIWDNTVKATGSSSDYQLNRFSGLITLNSPLSYGDKLSVASEDSAAAIFAKQAPASRYVMGRVNQIIPKIIVGFDGQFAIRKALFPNNTVVTTSKPDNTKLTTVRLMANNTMLFSDVYVNDYVYLEHDSSSPFPFAPTATGIFRVRRKGLNLNATSTSSIPPNHIPVAFTTGSNIGTVTYPTPHGLSKGNTVKTTYADVYQTILPHGSSSIEGTRVVVDIPSPNSFTFKADEAAIANGNAMMAFEFYPDSWIEIEAYTVSKASAILSVQNVTLTTQSFFAFKSENAIPQIVIFSDTPTMTLDAVVLKINESVIGGSAVKKNPRTYSVESNSLDNTKSTVAVLAVIGTAISMFPTPSVAKGFQSHLGFSESGNISYGPPISKGLLTSPLIQEQQSIVFDTNQTDILDTGVIDQPITNTSSNYPDGNNELSLTGINAGLVTRVYNNTTFAPYAGFVRGRYAIRPNPQTYVDSDKTQTNISIRMDEMPLYVTDTLTVTVDTDDTHKNSVIRVSKDAAIQDISPIIDGQLPGSTFIFKLFDSDDVSDANPNGKPFYDTSALLKYANLSDFNIVTRPTTLYYLYQNFVSDKTIPSTPYTLPDGNPAAAIVFRSETWGKIHKLRIVSTYATTPATPKTTITHRAAINIANMDAASAPVSPIVYITLPTGTIVNGSVFNAGNATITPSNFPWTTTGPAIVKLTIVSTNINKDQKVYKVGNLLNIADGHFYSGTYLITGLSGSDTIEVASPGVRSTSYTPVTLDATRYPISSYSMNPPSVQDILDAVANYSIENPLFSAEFVTSQPTTYTTGSKIFFPSYYTQGSSVFYTQNTTMQDSLDYQAFSTPHGCTMNIFDNRDPLGYFAVNQYEEPFLPTQAQIQNTGYSYIGEKVKLIPATNRALLDWIKLKAITPLSSYATLSRTSSDTKMQIATDQLGSGGSIHVSGVKANAYTSPLLAIPEKRGSYISTQVAYADAVPTGSLVSLTNQVTAPKTCAYRLSPPTDISVTTENTISQAYFRPRHQVNYSKKDAYTGRIEIPPVPLAGDLATPVNIQITIQAYPAFRRAKISCPLNTPHNARVGEMLYITSTALPDIYQCYPITLGTETNQYYGFPVIQVIDRNNFVIAIDNPTSVLTPVSVSSTDLLFIPVVKHEKNIQTYYKPFNKFREKITASMRVRIKTLGNGLTYCGMTLPDQAPGTGSSFILNDNYVATDDLVQFGEAFKLENQGIFKLIYVSEDNTGFIFMNPNASDELVTSDITTTAKEAFYGTTEWGKTISDSSSPNSADKRPIRIFDGNSIMEGQDKIVIGSPISVSSGKWFDSSLNGAWVVTKSGISTTSKALYIEFNVTTGAPSSPVNIPSLGVNVNSISFQEGSPLSVYRIVSGYTISPRDPTWAEMALAPSNNFSKMAPSLGTAISPLFKLNFPTDILTGVDGYKTYAELLAMATTVLDGSPTDVITYPGVRAAGTAIDLFAPLEKSIKMSLTLQSTPGVGIASIKDPVKSTITNYIKSLAVGESVIVSEIIKRGQQVPGVKSITVETTTPVAVNGIIPVGSIEVARILRDSDISV